MADPDGLSLINTLSHFPTEGVTINLMRALSIKRRVQRAIQDTNQFMAGVETQAETQAAAHPVDYAGLPDLRERGPYSVRFMELNLVVRNRDRPVPADLYPARHAGGNSR